MIDPKEMITKPQQHCIFQLDIDERELLRNTDNRTTAGNLIYMKTIDKANEIGLKGYKIIEVIQNESWNNIRTTRFKCEKVKVEAPKSIMEGIAGFINKILGVKA